MIEYPEVNIDSSEVKEIIYKYGEKINCNKGDSIITPFTKMEDAYFIEQGSFVFLVNDEKGNNLILKIDDEGTFLALVPMFISVSPIVVSITSLKESIIYKLKKNTIHELIDSSKVFRDYVIKDLSSNVYKNSYHSILLALKSNKEKVYNFLLTYADYENPLAEGWYPLKHNYKQQEIADFSGINRITVWKAMNELIEEGVVRTINNKIQVKLDFEC